MLKGVKINMEKSPVIHHVSVINDNVKESFSFYSNVLGLDLLMKTVNQDDIEMYHLFFSDTKGRPGTEFTVFPMKHGMRRQFGTNAIERTVFAVPSLDALYFWEKRLNDYGLFNCEVEEYNDSKILRFEDFAGVELGIVPVNDNTNEHFARVTDDIPHEHAIRGIHSVYLRVRYPEATVALLKEYYNLSIIKELVEGFPTTVLSKENSLFNQEIHVMEDKDSPLAQEGVGSAHHIALSVKDESELIKLEEKVNERNFTNSGIKDREFFQSFYFREPNGMLFETATEGSPFLKESYEGLVFEEVPLYLPSFLDPKRDSIERHLRY